MIMHEKLVIFSARVLLIKIENSGGGRSVEDKNEERISIDRLNAILSLRKLSMR